MWAPGKVIPTKVKSNHMYLTTTTYWAPLDDEIEEEDEAEQINTVTTAQQTLVTVKTNKWTRHIERRQATKLIIDSGATSNFVTEEMNLPKKEKSTKEVYLLDNTKLQASYRTFHSSN
jgi:hypothetical protein